MTGHEHKPVIREIDRWEVELKQLGITEWKAIACNRCGYHEFATGIDQESTLRKLANKLGISACAAIEAFR